MYIYIGMYQHRVIDFDGRKEGGVVEETRWNMCRLSVLAQIRENTRFLGWQFS